MYVSSSEIEWDINANGKHYIADVFITFNKSEPEVYYDKWNGQLCFEIKHTHAVDEWKIRDCEIAGIPIFEHTISKKLMFDGYTSSQSEFINQKNFISDRLSEKIYGKLLSNPDNRFIETTSKENEFLDRYIEKKRKYKELKSKYDELKRDNIDLTNINKFQAEKIVKLQTENNNLNLSNISLLLYKDSIEKNKLIKFLLRIFGIK